MPLAAPVTMTTLPEKGNSAELVLILIFLVSPRDAARETGRICVRPGEARVTRLRHPSTSGIVLRTRPLCRMLSIESVVGT